MVEKNQVFELLLQIKVRYEKDLLTRANVIGVGVGFKYIRGQATNQPAIIANVTQKKPLAELAEQDVVPPELEGAMTDVQEIGKISAF